MVAESAPEIRPASLVPVGESETAVSSVAAQVVAAVQARYALAKRMPRDYDEVRVRLLKECKRPRFAEVAIYHKPIGKGIEGPSIRFAEAALRCMTNVWPEVITILDSEDTRIVRVSVTDLEANITYSKDVTITKTVERSKAEGKDVLGSRLNSYGKTTYIVRATDDDILNKENALVSKALRTVGLRLIPGDILDEALEQVKRTLHDSAAQDPDAMRKRLVDAFASLGVGPAQLVAYLRHPLEQTSPAEITRLREIHAAIKDGETTWADVMGTGDEKASESGQSKTSRTKDVLEQRRRGAAGKAKSADPEPIIDEKTGEVIDAAPVADPGANDYGPPDWSGGEPTDAA